MKALSIPESHSLRVSTNYMTQGKGVFGQTIRLCYRPSRQVFTLFALMHSLALSSLLFTGIPVMPGLVLAVPIILGLCRTVQLYRQEWGTQLVLDRDNNWLLAGTDGVTTPARLLPGSVVHPRLMVLRFRDENHRVRAFILTGETGDTDSLRRLRVRLRYRE